MPPSSYRVRFSSNSKYQIVSKTADPALSSCPSASASDIAGSRPSHTKSRYGCNECKRRRVKCDETFPVCLRCQRRGSLCLGRMKPGQWRTETPWLTYSLLLNSWTGDSQPNKRLVQYWVEQTSQLLSLDRGNNPLSLPLLQYVAASPSLLHAIQSLSAGHEAFFTADNLDICLEERGKAFRLVREELQDLDNISITSMLTIFLLGVSSPWIDLQPDTYGKEHLQGARAMLKGILLKKKKLGEDPLIKFMLGWYLYWDMTCALFDNDASSEIDVFEVADILQEDSGTFHSMIGFSSKLYAQIAAIGRYCQRLPEQHTRNYKFEEEMERQLLSWQPCHDNEELVQLSFAYRNHGLLMLYRSRGSSIELTRKVRTDDNDDSEEVIVGTEAVIKSYALESIRMMMEVPVSEPSANFQSLPLLSCAAELTSEDQELRNAVTARFKGLYSASRVLVNMWALELLEELWALRDCGIGDTWMDLSFVKGWKLCFS